MLLASLICLLLLSACGVNAEKKEQKNTATEQQFKTKTIENIEMQLNKIRTTESGKSSKKNIVVFTLAFKNNDQMTVGIGGGDFKLKAGKDTYSVYAPGNSIGQEIAVNDKVTGDVYFEIPTSLTEATLVYMPTKEVLGEWKVKIPESE